MYLCLTEQELLDEIAHLEREIQQYRVRQFFLDNILCCLVLGLFLFTRLFFMAGKGSDIKIFSSIFGSNVVCRKGGDA